ncbi:MAG: tetratricopeptide (TPR) repeat protein, partial [Myxococcota bacterium]
FVRFLGEIYADYGEMAELLSSSAIDVERDQELHLRLANASFQLGSLVEALEHYSSLAGGDSGQQSLVEQRIGDIQSRLGNPRIGVRHLEAALKLDNGNSDARRLLEKAKASLEDVAGGLYAKAHEAFDRGDLDSAAAFCQEVSDQGLKHSDTERLHQKIVACNQRDAAISAVVETKSLVKSKDWRGASEALRRARQLDEAVWGEAKDLADTVEAALAVEQCTGQLQVARSRQAEGKLVGALMSLSRALDTGAPIPSTDVEEPLMARLQRFEARSGAGRRPTERQLEGLAALHLADQALIAGDPRAAEAALKDARRYLKGDAELAELTGRLGAVSAGARAQAVAGLIERAGESEAAGDLRAALIALDRAVDLDPGQISALEPERRRLRDALKASDAETQVASQLQRLVDAEAWWRVRRAVRDSSVDSARIREFSDAATVQIQSRWALTARPVAKGSGCELKHYDLAEKYGSRVVVHVDEAGGRLLIGVDSRLIIAALDTLKVTADYALPVGLSISRATTRIFGCEGGVVIFSSDGRVVTRLTEGPSGLVMDDRYELTRALSGATDDARLASETQFDPTTGRWLFLLTDQTGRYDSRLLSIGVEDGQQHGEERFSGRAFNLRRIWGTDQFTVQKVLTLHRMTASAFNFAVVDGHAKVHDRPLFGDLMEPMHAVRRVTKLPSDACYLVHYWFSEPFTGQVIEQSSGMLQAKSDWSIFYQSSRPEDWLGAERVVAGSVAVHESSKRIALPYRTAEKKPTHGISVLAIEQWRERADIELPPGHRVLRLLEDRTRDQVLAIMMEEGEITIRRVDVAEGRLA